MEKDGPNIVKMAIKSEEAAARLVGPDLDLVVVTARDEKGLGSVKVDSAHRAIVFFESVNQRSHAVIPELDGRRVKSHQNPWSRCIIVSRHHSFRTREAGKATSVDWIVPLGVECNAFGTRRLGLELHKGLAESLTSYVPRQHCSTHLGQHITARGLHVGGEVKP